MRFHVVGVGPIGSLVAFHLRRSLPPNHDVNLILRTHALAKQGREQGRPIRIEYDGVVSTAYGFKTESMDQHQNKVFDLVFNRAGKLRLPTQDRRAATDLGALDTASSQGESGDIESLIVTCKAYSTLNVLKRLQHRLTPESTVVLLQNGGLGVYEQIIDAIFRNPEERPHFILVSINHGAWLKAPNHVIHAGIGTLNFGIVPDGRRDFEKSLHDPLAAKEDKALKLDDILYPQTDPLHTRYRSLRNTVAVLRGLSGLQPVWEPISTLQLYMRRKLVVNSVINPLTALLGCRNGELFGNAAAQRLASRICGEAAQVFAAEARTSTGPESDATHVYIPPALRKAQLMEEWQRVARLTAGNLSSMLSDIRKGNTDTEIDYLNGYVVRLASRHGVHVPVNASMVDLVRLRTSIPIDTPL